jgi:hypothetical protein
VNIHVWNVHRHSSPGRYFKDLKYTGRYRAFLVIAGGGWASKPLNASLMSSRRSTVPVIYGTFGNWRGPRVEPRNQAMGAEFVLINMRWTRWNAARAGHSVTVLLAVYAHCIPGHDQIASRRIEQALGVGSRPAAGPRKHPGSGSIPSVMRPCHSWTQWDTAGLGTPGQRRKPARDLREHPPKRSTLRKRPLDARLLARSAAGR